MGSDFLPAGVHAAGCKPPPHLERLLEASTGRGWGESASQRSPANTPPASSPASATAPLPTDVRVHGASAAILRAPTRPVRTRLDKHVPARRARPRGPPGRGSPTRSARRVNYQTRRGEAGTARAGRLARAKGRQGRCAQRGPGWRPLHAPARASAPGRRRPLAAFQLRSLAQVHPICEARAPRRDLRDPGPGGRGAPARAMLGSGPGAGGPRGTFSQCSRQKAYFLCFSYKNITTFPRISSFPRFSASQATPREGKAAPSPGVHSHCPWGALVPSWPSARRGHLWLHRPGV